MVSSHRCPPARWRAVTEQTPQGLRRYGAATTYHGPGSCISEVVKVLGFNDVSAKEAAMHQHTVDELVSGARAGDAEAWNELVARFLPLVSAVIARHRLRAADADDVNQTVWLRLVEHLDDLREPRALPGWLATTTRNESLLTIRRRTRDLPVDPQGAALDGRADDGPEAGDDLVRDLRCHALREALQELPDQRRELLVLLLADPPLSYDEISERLGIPKGSIGPTRARALEQLRNTRALRVWAAVEPEFQGGGRHGN
jgi:RNA polymerase sigma factor (sigma-70 family)